MKGFKLYGIIGIAALVLAEILLFSKVPFVMTWFTPIAWTAYIMFIDALVLKRKGTSILTRKPRWEFWLLLALSILFWMLYEAYNQYMRNWYYVNLPSNLYVRIFDYMWAYATIFPGMFETADLLSTFSFFKNFTWRKWLMTNRTLWGSFAVGLIFCVGPLFFPSRIAIYLWAPVWLGFIFLMEPLTYWMKEKSLYSEVEYGKWGTVLSLIVAGYICGLLWEFWNFWSTAKWIYTVPFLPDIKYFEMPVVGFSGFGPFAVASYALYIWGRAFVVKTVLFFTARKNTPAKISE